MNEPIALFAVKQEAAFVDTGRIRVLVTGMGGRQATEKARAFLTVWNPSHVFTCGFAGGLNPQLKNGMVVCSIDEQGSAYADRLRSRNIQEVTFQCADQVIATSDQKRSLRESTKADAVEMESAHIQRVCRERGVSCDVIRVISDAADEDLPLDFSAFMTNEQRMRWGRLFLHLATHPSAVPALMRFQKHLKLAARNLAGVLHDLMPPHQTSPRSP